MWSKGDQDRNAFAWAASGIFGHQRARTARSLKPTSFGRPVAPDAKSLLSGRRIVISTGTKNLQEQLFFKDIPFLEKHLGVPLRVCYMKGRGNYACRQKIYDAEKEPVLSGLEEVADFQIIRPNGFTELEAKYAFQMDDGAIVYIENIGIRFGPKEALDRIAKGEIVDPALIYFRSVPKFETGSAKYRWLMENLFIGVGARHPDRVEIEVYQVM